MSDGAGLIGSLLGADAVGLALIAAFIDWRFAAFVTALGVVYFLVVLALLLSLS